MIPGKNVEFRKVRDFGDVLNVTFAFLRQHISVLGKSLLLIVGPFALLSGLSSMGMWSGLDMDPMADAFEDNINYALFGLSYLFTIGMSLIAWVLAVTVVNGYMLKYEEGGGNGITLQAVVDVVKARFWDMLGTALFAFVLYVIGFMALMLPMILITTIATAGAGFVAGLLIFIIVITWLVAMLFFIVMAFMLFPVRMHERLNVMDALKRCRYLLVGNYGSSLAVLIVSSLLMMILGLLFSTPSYILLFAGGMHAMADGEAGWMKYLLTLTTAVGSLGGSLLYAIPVAAMGLQYFSLVEKKDKAGLMQRIDEIAPQEDDLF